MVSAAWQLQHTDFFTYDSLGRRTRLNDPDIGEWNYTYDVVGNLISQSGGGGNLITGDGFFREYNTLNQLVRIRNGSSINDAVIEEYTYDPYGQRVKIWRNDSAGTVVYTPFRDFMQVRNNSGIYNFSYIYDGSVLVARVNPDGSKNHYHPDHLGSTTLITDNSGNIVEETFYEPFGAVTSGGTADVKLYTGQFDDTATNQYYYGARYYLPSIGKFMQADTLLPNVYDPQQLNRYAYVNNNPYKNKDPSGHQAGQVVAGLGTSVISGATVVYGGVVIAVVAVGFGAAFAGETLREVYPPEQLYKDVNSYNYKYLSRGYNAFNYIYETVGPKDKLLKLLEEIEESDANKKREEFEKFRTIKDVMDAVLESTNQNKPESAKTPNVNGASTTGGGSASANSWSNVIQRSDGTWVVKGGSDDDGSRYKNVKKDSKQR